MDVPGEVITTPEHARFASEWYQVALPYLLERNGVSCLHVVQKGLAISSELACRVVGGVQAGDFVNTAAVYHMWTTLVGVHDYDPLFGRATLSVSAVFEQLAKASGMIFDLSVDGVYVKGKLQQGYWACIRRDLNAERARQHLASSANQHPLYVALPRGQIVSHQGHIQPELCQPCPLGFLSIGAEADQPGGERSAEEDWAQMDGGIEREIKNLGLAYACPHSHCLGPTYCLVWGSATDIANHVQYHHRGLTDEFSVLRIDVAGKRYMYTGRHGDVSIHGTWKLVPNPNPAANVENQKPTTET